MRKAAARIDQAVVYCHTHPGFAGHTGVDFFGAQFVQPPQGVKQLSCLAQVVGGLAVGHLGHRHPVFFIAQGVAARLAVYKGGVGGAVAVY